ncbi:2-iminoacetate synthase [Prosthecobacter debontii]|uniref:2-iminoacetate synthase n=1 Tax=Prosthecobacter debontii TaxID=48467 RepID=A0A1T4WIH6_9BACT|nr:2-iminoacetate synthase ThiH [Prosthecobacter debontii]SKA77120.1 2-iminoacetate synthase [Prosthecobacter debontii]
MQTSFIPALDALPERKSPLMERFWSLLETKSPSQLEAMARESRLITRRNFGRTMRLFAPLYVSNECVNNCSYCGFSRDNTSIMRVTLTVDQVVREARHLTELGFRNILLVAGEHPRFVSEGYLEECIRAIRDFVPTIGIEVGPMEAPEYERMVKAGAEGLVVYHETYDRAMYTDMHTAGPKKDFDWRLACPERGYEGGFRRIGIGALFGLSDWRLEALRLAAHLEHLYKHCWKSSFTVAFPRLRPAAGGFQPLTGFPDWALVQTICAFRLTFPEVGIVLSTREPASLRDALAPLGITTMSAGSHTEPGGYTGAGQDDLHQTVRGRRVELEAKTEDARAEGQFGIADERSPAEVAEMLQKQGLDAVWKDWDPAILTEGALAA